MGPNSISRRAGSMPKDGELAKGVGPMRSSKIKSPNVLVISQGCGPKGYNSSPFQGHAVPIKGFKAGFERPTGGAYADGPGTVCLGVSVEVDKAKSSPSSSSM